jgi:hypothetical protein
MCVEKGPADVGLFFGQAGAVNAVRMMNSQDRYVGPCSTKNLLDKRARHDDNIIIYAIIVNIVYIEHINCLAHTL